MTPNEILAAMMQQHGHTQAWLAQKSGVGDPYVCMILSGKRPVTEDFALKLPQPYRRDVIKALVAQRIAAALKLKKEAGRK